MTCDEGYGQDPAFRDGRAALGLGYLAEVPQTTRVWLSPPAPGCLSVPGRPHRPPEGPRAVAVREVAAQVPASAWQRCLIKAGSQGPLWADCAALRVRASRRRQPGPAVWLFLRRHPDTHVLKTYLAHGPADLPLDTLVWLAGMRWPIETCFQEGKQLLGLGDYEGRSWTGWHHHMTLCLLAHFFLVRQTWRREKKPGP